jgi:hypothetical protein
LSGVWPASVSVEFGIACGETRCFSLIMSPLG